MVRIYIIRHGETEPNRRFAFIGRKDVPLTDDGVAQAEDLCRRLNAKSMPDVIFTSPLRRARQTIQPFLDKNPDIPVNTSFNLIERDFGAWDNIPIADIGKSDPDGFKRWQKYDLDFAVPNGESLQAVQDRVSEFLDKLCPEYEGKTVFLVTHLCAARHIISHLLGLSPERSRCFTMKNAHYAVIDFDNTVGYGTVKYLNI